MAESLNPVAVGDVNLHSSSLIADHRMKMTLIKKITYSTLTLVVFLVGCSNKKNPISAGKQTEEVKVPQSSSATRSSNDGPQTPYGVNGVSLETSSAGPKFRF